MLEMKEVATTKFVIGQATSGIRQSSLEPAYAQRYQIARKCGEVCYSNDYQKMGQWISRASRHGCSSIPRDKTVTVKFVYVVQDCSQPVLLSVSHHCT